MNNPVSLYCIYSLIFLVPANVTVSPEVVIAPEVNSSNSFTCKGFGIPIPVLVWDSIEGDLEQENISISNHSEVLDSGIEVAISILTFHEFSNHTEGNYKCTGFNNISLADYISDFDQGEFLLASKLIIP